MRKRLFAAALLFASITLFTACNASEMSSLSELSKPYAGFYECKEISIGGEDVTDKFDFIRAELSYGGMFELKYREKNGGKGEFHGTYSADAEHGEITLSMPMGLQKKSFTFPMEKGKIHIDVPLEGKMLHAVFAMP